LLNLPLREKYADPFDVERHAKHRKQNHKKKIGVTGELRDSETFFVHLSARWNKGRHLGHQCKKRDAVEVIEVFHGCLLGLGYFSSRSSFVSIQRLRRSVVTLQSTAR
jgi:hypothetical protein